MAQRVDRGGLGEAAGAQRGPKGALQAALAHGGVAARGGGVRAGEEPSGVAVGAPVGAQQRQAALGQGDVAVLVALGVAEVQQLALAVDVADLQADAFLQPQPAGVDGGQADAIRRAVHTGQDLTDLGGTKHRRQFLLVGRADQVEGGPVAPQGVLEEELDAAQRQGRGAAGDVLDVVEVEEVLAEVLFADLVGGLAAVGDELADGADVGLLRLGGQAAQAQVLEHALA